MGKCSCCKKLLLLSDFHKNKSKYNGIQNYCKKCRAIKDKKYYKNGGKIRQDKWTDNNREKHNEDTMRYRHSKKGRETIRKYTKTDTWKNNMKKQLARRRQKLGWILMFPNPFDDSILVEYHHITDAYVVAVPRDLHKLYSGKFHREKVMSIVKQIYLGGN